MRLAGLRSLLFGAVALLLVGTFAGCENPLDPLNKSEEISGLSYIDVAATWDRWDSDPQYDGVLLDMSYFNEFGDTLAFHDKPHSIVIEFWSQQDTGLDTDPPGPSFLVQDELLFSKTVEFSNADDSIRVPVEAYLSSIPSDLFLDPNGVPLTEVKGFLVVRVFPPLAVPRTELLVALPDTIFFKPEVAQDTPNP
jgi:hypothetical protein